MGIACWAWGNSNSHFFICLQHGKAPRVIGDHYPMTLGFTSGCIPLATIEIIVLVAK